MRIKAFLKGSPLSTVGGAALAALVVSLAVVPTGQAFAQAQQGECGVGTPQQGTAPNANPGSGSLTEKLDDCNGVLKPPSVGDGEIVEPAPPSGQMPVITPNDLPKDGNSAQQP
ncbi:hypothetical protein ASG25_12350 [Rhizobium sp. Leaf384]|uniref:hypothetical protein n=1 Tax=unclassified Rhizobium TaxID=2613769 RepID=UPI000713DA43|nr:MULTISPECIES: hypothetical protein [unclassified Rhizobium]KQS79331.1 hypothetical protein ASG25_12350 [Rhizobium sp. Leaf384]KQS82899.1 hypothetical protein ASG58_06165 [Rhizobium sp. Leaf383]